MTAFRAAYSDIKLIKTRKCVQIIFEIPQEEFDAAYEVLGGLPNPAAERWFGIAALFAGAGTSTASPLMTNGTEKGYRNPGGDYEVAHDDVTHHGKEAGRDESTPARPRKSWRDLSPTQQAAMRCDEPAFAAFLKEQRPDDWHESQGAAECVRLICAIKSRSELATNNKARVIWHQLDEQYGAWKALEHA